MDVTANCNLSKNVLTLLAKQKFGLKCFDETASKILLQSYINSLDCNVKQYICIDDAQPCENITSFLCKFYIFKINVNSTSTVFNFNVEQFHEGLAPYQYLWSFDQNIFELVPGNTDKNSILKLRWKNGVVPTAVTTIISVTVRDANGCLATESCEVTFSTSYQSGLGYSYQTGIGCF